MTLGTLQDARKEIVEILQLLDEIRSVPIQIPAKADPFPFAIAHMGNGEMAYHAGQMRGLHNIEIEIHVSRRDLKRNYDRIEKLTQDIGYHLITKHQAHKFTKLEHWDRIIYTLGPSEWAGIQTLAVFMVLENVKVYTAIT